MLDFIRVFFDEDAADATSGGGTILDSGSDAQGDGGDPAASSSSPDTSWFNQLPDEMQGDASIQRFKDKGIEDFAKSFQHAQKMIGKNKLAMPGPNATSEEKDAFFNALGRPESPDKYSPLENLPEGVSLNEDLMASFHKAAHEAGLSDNAAASMTRWYIEHEQQVAEQMAKNAKNQQIEGVKALKMAWGNAFDTKLELAKGLIEQFDDGGHLMNAMAETGAANNPTILKFLAEVGTKFGEDSIMGGKSRSSLGLTPAEAQEEIRAIQSDPENRRLLNDPREKNNPARQKLVERMTELAKLRVSS